MQRRELLKAIPMLAAAGAAVATSRAAAAERVTPVYRAAVMRVPVVVPPNADAVDATRARNAQAMVAAIESAMRGPGSKPRILVFPVLQFISARRAVSGVPMSAVAVDLVSEPLDRTIFAPVIAACRRHDCYVATSTQEKVPQLPGRYFHTGFIMGPQGLVLRSPKSQARSAPEVTYLRDIPDEYMRIFGRDSIMPVADTPLGKLACFVEGEAEVLEASRLLASKGAQLILHVSLEHDDVPWLALKQAIGFQCQTYLLTGATSRHLLAKNPEGEWDGGAATIVGPEGELLASLGGRDEGFAMADIDLARIALAKKKHAHNTTPAWSLYRDLYKG